jgi:hypothetical protein
MPKVHVEVKLSSGTKGVNQARSKIKQKRTFPVNIYAPGDSQAR